MSVDGIQKTVSDGLRYLANKVAEGSYGTGDEAFQNDYDREALTKLKEGKCLDT